MRIYTLLLCLLVFSSTSAFSQPFTEIILEQPGFSYGSLEWGDYDNDSNMDFIVTGFVTNAGRQSIIYKNAGDGTFDPLPENTIMGVNFGEVKWVDYDNDGDLDLFVSGRVDEQIEYTSTLYRNDGDDLFTPAWSFAALDYASADWGDYNNDGYIDLILIGAEHPATATWIPKTYLYENDQSGGFFIADTSFTAVYLGSCRFADYDSDSDLDLILTGLGPGGATTTIYRNDKGSFTDIQPGLTGLTTSTSAWADFDGDGDFDIVLGGSEGYISATKALIYSNEGDDIFTVAPVNGDEIPQVSNPSFDLADYDNDGDTDVLLTGQIGLTAERTTAIYRNDGNFSFAFINPGLTPVRNGAARWADYDNDGDLDILLCGNGPSNDKILNLYRNESTSPNSQPLAPEGLFTAVNDNEIVLSWENGSDPETPQQSLTYNIRIGTAPGLSNVFSAMASADGYRYILQHGNANMNTTWTINALADGEYFWSVQTLDGNHVGSDFSTEETFTVGEITAVQNQVVADEDGVILHQNYPNPANTHTNVAFEILDTGKNISSGAIRVSLTLHDLSGREIRSFYENSLVEGNYNISLDLNGLPKGLYFCRLKAGNTEKVNSLVVQ